jgi:hypothetical protein
MTLSHYAIVGSILIGSQCRRLIRHAGDRPHCGRSRERPSAESYRRRIPKAGFISRASTHPINRIEGEIADILARRPPLLGEQERQQLMQLGADLDRAWSHPAATVATRKRILCAALNEIVVRRVGAVFLARLQPL